MTVSHHKFAPVLYIFFPLYLIACGGPAGVAVNRELNEAGVPQWVAQGTSTIKTPTARLFYGLGAVSAVGDFSIQASIAERRAKREIERMLDRYLQVVVRDYIASGQASRHGISHSQLQRQIQEYSATDSSDVEIVEHWHDKPNKKVYAVAQLQWQAVKQRLVDAGDISAGFRGYFQSDGAHIFDRIAQNGR